LKWWKILKGKWLSKIVFDLNLESIKIENIKIKIYNYMDQEIKNEFKKINKEFENLVIMVKNGFDQTATKNDLEELATKEDLEAVKKELTGVKEELTGVKEDLEEKIDDLSAKVQEQKNVPLVRKVDEKLNKEIEIHSRNKILSSTDIKEIKDLNPFPSKPAVMP